MPRFETTAVLADRCPHPDTRSRPRARCIPPQPEARDPLEQPHGGVTLSAQAIYTIKIFSRT